MFNRFGEQVLFGVEKEDDKLKTRGVGTLPSIEMAYDNDV